MLNEQASVLNVVNVTDFASLALFVSLSFFCHFGRLWQHPTCSQHVHGQLPTVWF